MSGEAPHEPASANYSVAPAHRDKHHQLAQTDDQPIGPLTYSTPSHSCLATATRANHNNTRAPIGQHRPMPPLMDTTTSHELSIAPGGATRLGHTHDQPGGHGQFCAGLRLRGATSTPVSKQAPTPPGPDAAGEDALSTTTQDHALHIADDAEDVIEEIFGAPAPPLGPSSRPSVSRWPFPASGMEPGAAALYDAARSAALEGRPAPRLDHTTTLVTQVWDREATNHPADEIILQGIRRGFSIQYNGPPIMTPPATYNHQSAVNYPDHIDAYVTRETAESALSGPYQLPPFTPWFVASPMMSREKPNGDGRRVIVDLSFPDGGINQYIAPHTYDGRDAIHSLPTVTSAVATIASTPPGDIHMTVVDLSRAYRQFPVTPLDWPLLGIYWRDAWSFDRRLPFGCRMSSFIMQSVADFIVRALASRRITAHMYLDDIIVISPTRHVADRQYRILLDLLQEMGLAVATHKLQPPSPAVTWLGIYIDMDANQLSIPTAKLGQIRDCMAAAAGKRYIKKKYLQRLIGLANHLSKVVRAARTFICRLLAALRAAKTGIIRVTREMRADLAWYVKYLSSCNGKAILPVERVVMRIWADACLKGAGASDGCRYYEHVFTNDFSSAHHIAQLEGLNCLAAVRAFVTHDCAGGTIEVMCDNRPSVDAFTSGRARDEVLAACARALWFHAAATDVDIRFTHVPGEGMALPDALSRAAVDAAGRARADRLITKLSLRRVRIKGADFNYKSFL